MRAGSRIRDSGLSDRLAASELRTIDALRIRHLTSDSRAVKRGDTFVAYRGEAREIGRAHV